MPLLGKLLAGLGSWALGLLTALVGAKVAIRLTAATALGVAYVTAAFMFSTLIAPWIGALFNTQYGALLGLLFPPVSGTVIVSLFAYYMAVVGVRYITTLTKVAVG